MQVYGVTVWDTSLSKDPEEWSIESPPVRISAPDSYEAAKKVLEEPILYLGSRVYLDLLELLECSSGLQKKN